MLFGNKILTYTLSAALFISLVAFQPWLSKNKKEVSLDIMMNSLTSGHYNPKAIDDSLSKHIYHNFLQRMDYSKNLFTKIDLEQLKKYEFKIDDEINNATFDFFNLCCEIVDKRLKQERIANDIILKSPFDFYQKDSIETDPEKRQYAANETELNKIWALSLKYQTAIQLADLMERQRKAKEKNDTTVKQKPFVDLEKDARAKVLKNNTEYFTRIDRIDNADRFNIYLNTISSIFDPHTEFFPPKEKKNFDINMSGQLEGIGAQLQEKDGYIRVSSIVPGSASSRQGQLKAGHIILKVAQGADEPIDLEGMRLDNAVELIRGKKGTEVRLTVKDVDGRIFVIPIIRDVVLLEETYAQSAIISGKKDIGYIKLPVFYSDFNGGGKGRHSSEDVKKEIEKLKKENVSSIILDLRNNGGGSLQDAVDMAGLFISQGPIVQVKSRSSLPTVLQDFHPEIEYDGPVIVMVNYNSASASEILAAAMQDYKRAIIVGSPGTFGKGTVQRFLNLDDYLLVAFDSLKPLGSLKITFQKFYRINGGSTQLKGVTPDIIFPDVSTYVETGEKDMDFPIEWDEIAPANYTVSKMQYGMDKLKEKSAKRIAENNAFSTVQEKSLELKAQKNESVQSLNIDSFIKEKQEIEASNKKYEDIVAKEIAGFSIKNLTSDLKSVESDSTKMKRNKEWLKGLQKDIYLYETTNILGDLK